MRAYILQIEPQLCYVKHSYCLSALLRLLRCANKFFICGMSWWKMTQLAGRSYGGAYLAKPYSAKPESAVQESAKPYFAKPGNC